MYRGSEAPRHREQFTQRLFQNETGIGMRPIKRHFGGWSALRQAAGLKPCATVRHRFRQEEILEDLYRTWRGKGFNRPRLIGGRI